MQNKNPQQKIQAVDEKTASIYLGISVQTLRNWRHQRRGPHYLKVGGRSVRYHLQDLDSYLDQCRISL
jgi:excisionase family DNA binding protein